MQKTELKKSSFFNEISLEYKATKFPQNYMEWEESQIPLTEGLKDTSNFDFESNICSDGKVSCQ